MMSKKGSLLRCLLSFALVMSFAPITTAIAYADDEPTAPAASEEPVVPESDAPAADENASAPEAPEADEPEAPAEDAGQPEAPAPAAPKAKAAPKQGGASLLADDEKEVKQMRLKDSGSMRGTTLRGTVLDYLGLPALSTATIGFAPKDDPSNVTTIDITRSYTFESGDYIAYQRKNIGSIFSPNYVWDEATAVPFKVTIYHEVKFAVANGPSAADILKDGESVKGQTVEIDHGATITVSAANVKGYNATITDAKGNAIDGEYTVNAGTTITATYEAKAKAAVTVNSTNGGTVKVVSDGVEVTDGVIEGYGFEVSATPDTKNGFYLKSVAITKNGEPVEGTSVDEVAADEEYVVTVEFAKASLKLSNGSIPARTAAASKADKEAAIVAAVNPVLDPEGVYELAKVEYKSYDALISANDRWNEVDYQDGGLLDPSHSFGAQSTETIRLTYKAEGYPELQAEATVSLVKENVQLQMSGVVNTAYGDDLKEAILKQLVVTTVQDPDDPSKPVHKIDVTADDITINPTKLEASRDTQEVTVSFKGNKYYNSGQTTAQVKVAKAKASMTIGNAVAKYDGKPHSVDVAVTPEGVSNFYIVTGISGDATAFVSVFTGPIYVDIPVLGKRDISGLVTTVVEEVLNSDAPQTIDQIVNTIMRGLDVVSPILPDEVKAQIQQIAQVIAYVQQARQALDGAIDFHVGKWPTKAGAYVVAGAITEANYTTDLGVGGLLITPQGIRDVKIEFNTPIDGNAMTVEQAAKQDYTASVVPADGGDAIKGLTPNLIFTGVTADGAIYGPSRTAPTEPGRYVETASFANGNYMPLPVSRTYTIKRPEITIEVEDASVVYDGRRHSLPFTITTADGKDVTSGATVLYNGSVVRPNDAGTYTVTIMYPSDNPLRPVTATAQLTITKRPVTLSVPGTYTKTYGNDDSNYSYAVERQNGDRGLIPGQTLGTIRVDREAGEHVGKGSVDGAYKLTPKVVTPSLYYRNYDVEIKTSTLTILPYAITINTKDASKTYGSADPAFDFDVNVDPIKVLRGETNRNGLRWDDTKSVLDLVISRTDKGENVGKYDIDDVTVGSANADYTVTLNKAGQLSIERKAAYIVPQPVVKQYGQKDPEFKAVVTGTVNGEELAYKLEREPGEDVGTAYKIKVVVDQDAAVNANYSIYIRTSELVITAATAIDVQVSMDDWTYGDEASTPATVVKANGTTVENPDVTYTYSTDGETWTSDVPTAVGEYFVKAKVAPESNYAGGEGVASFKINPRDITVVIKNDGKVYGDADPAELFYDTTPEGALVAGDDLGVVLTRDAGEDVGAYKIHADLSAANPNYTITVTAEEAPAVEAPSLMATDEGGEEAEEPTGTFTITPKPIKIVIDDKSKVKGDEDPELTFTTQPELVKGDDLSITLVRDEGEDAGAYTIHVDSSTLNANYELVEVVEGTLTITEPRDPDPKPDPTPDPKPDPDDPDDPDNPDDPDDPSDDPTEEDTKDGQPKTGDSLPIVPLGAAAAAALAAGVVAFGMRRREQ